LDKEGRIKRQAITGKDLTETGARFGHWPRKSPRRLAEKAAFKPSRFTTSENKLQHTKVRILKRCTENVPSFAASADMGVFGS
jgi:hypothetical protein